MLIRDMAGENLPNAMAARRILIVDDDKAVRMAIRVLLEHEGFEVIVAESGRRALEAVEAAAVNLVIVDIFMPGMDGLETIRAFHRCAPGLPIIAMSGFMFRDSSAPAPDFLGMATKLGATRSLQKPFRPAELLSAVEACLSGSPARHEARLPPLLPGVCPDD
jgi:CheY-like chemotaxis protein